MKTTPLTINRVLNGFIADVEEMSYIAIDKIIGFRILTGAIPHEVVIKAYSVDRSCIVGEYPYDNQERAEHMKIQAQHDLQEFIICLRGAK